MDELLTKAQKLKDASNILKTLNTKQKNYAILKIAKSIEKNQDFILSEK